MLGGQLLHGLGVGTGLGAAVDRRDEQAVAVVIEERRAEREPAPHLLEGVVADETEALERVPARRRVLLERGDDAVDALVDRLDAPHRPRHGGDDVALVPVAAQQHVLAADLLETQREDEQQQETEEEDPRHDGESQREFVSRQVGHGAASYTGAMRRDELKALLSGLLEGSTTVDEAVSELQRLPLHDLGFARVDTHRELRQGMPEAIYAEHKTPDQVVAIAAALLAETTSAVIATRVPPETAQRLLGEWPEARYDAEARFVTLRSAADETAPAGTVAVVSGGTSDRPVALEAALTAEAVGLKVERIDDVGVAGLHRVLAQEEVLRTSDVVIVVAGMEGALPSLVGGLTPAPVIAVPTSVGYGASLGGLAALLGMLNSCAAGVVVTNIDNGFGAAMAALRQLNRGNV